MEQRTLQGGPKAQRTLQDTKIALTCTYGCSGRGCFSDPAGFERGAAAKIFHGLNGGELLGVGREIAVIEDEGGVFGQVG